MNIQYLKFFYDAALSGSISESARRNFVTQSAVSQGIAKLEISLGLILTEHKKQRFLLTPEGELILEKAREVFSAVRSLQDVVNSKQKQPRLPLYFVTTHAIGLSLLPSVLATFKERYPDVEVHFLFGGVGQIKGWLKQGIAEFAIVLKSPDFREYAGRTISTGSFGLYKHEEEAHPIDQTGLFVEQQEGFLVPEWLNVWEKSPPALTALNSWELIARMIGINRGYGLLPDFTAQQSCYAFLQSVPGPTLPYVLESIYLKKSALSYSAQAFLEVLSELKEGKTKNP